MAASQRKPNATVNVEDFFTIIPLYSCEGVRVTEVISIKTN